MTKYLVFKNQPDSGQVNEPGSREEMASEIADIVAQGENPPNYYIAYSVDDSKATFETLRNLAEFSVEINDESAELWVSEIQPMVKKAQRVDEALGEASGLIYQAMNDYNNAIEANASLQGLTRLSINALDYAFEHFDVESSYEVSTKVEEIYSVEYLDS